MEGNELRTLRTTKGWSQAQLAREAGTEASIISHYERGTRGITRMAATLFRLLLTPPPDGTQSTTSV